MKAVFLDTDSMSPSDLDFSPLKDVIQDWTFCPHTSPEQRLQHIGAAEVIVSNKVVLDKATLEQLTNTRFVQIAATGYNNIDLSCAESLGMAVANVRDYGSETVAQFTFALLLTLTNQVSRYQTLVTNLDWSQHDQFGMLNFPNMELADKTFGIIGYGAIGQVVARIAKGFGMQVLISESLAPQASGDSQQQRAPLSDVLANSDVVSLHCPLNEHTSQMMNASRLAQMKPTAYLLNTARGGLINEQDLLAALQTGVIAGAGLDGLSQEPPSTDHCLVTNSLDNLVVTPHCAWGSREARQRIIEIIANNIQAWLKGERLNRIDSKPDQQSA